MDRPVTSALLPLREDIAIFPGPCGPAGLPSWTLYDPARHRYIRIGWLEFEALSRWALGDAGAVAASVADATPLRPTAEEIDDIQGFAAGVGLLRDASAENSRRLLASVQARKVGAGRWLLHNYLFLRLRLVNPDRALRALLPWLGFTLTRGFAAAMAATALLGLLLIVRQWDVYANSLVQLFSLEGAALIGLSLLVCKLAHEFGHGLMARKFGCRVPSMGVAFLVLWPVLWTDTTDAWRLRNRSERLLIDCAGMGAEMTLAAIASVLWSVLPDGGLRSAAFILSSATWVTTLFVNLNPLMRFDGYYILSDVLGVPNLQDRAFALGRWQLREALFGVGAPPPERHAGRLRAALLAYAYATWVYRFFLFLGIAVLVYHFAFKALGLLLGAVEVWFFVLRPIVAELHVWSRIVLRRRASLRAAFTLAAMLAGLAALFVPWHTEVVAPALLRANRQATLYAAEPGTLQQLSAEGRRVQAGEVLFAIASPDIAHRRLAAAAQLAGLQTRMVNQAFDSERARDVAVSRSEAERTAASLAHADAQAEDLLVRAPFAGVLRDVPPHLRANLPIARREPLGLLVDPATQLAEAYVEEADLARLAVGSRARFLPESGDAAVMLVVADIAVASSHVLDTAELASDHGGGIPVRRDRGGRAIPDGAFYRVLLRPVVMATIAQRMPGSVAIDAERASLAGRLYRLVVAVAIREFEL
jgi:putative peptide zinc metalloprotease protein